MKDRLQQVVVELCAAYEEYSIVFEVEHRARVDALISAGSQGLGVSATENLVKCHTVDLAIEAVKLQQHIKALETERDFLQFAISHF